jgi:hypothetical protein
VNLTKGCDGKKKQWCLMCKITGGSSYSGTFLVGACFMRPLNLCRKVQIRCDFLLG